MFRSMFVRKSTSLLLAVSIFISSTLCGCGGQAARPTDRYMPGDEKKSCSALLTEIKMLDNEISKKQQDKSDRDFWNTVEFLGGLLVIVPFFFMDSKGSEEIEIDALVARQTLLKGYFAEKGCSVADPSAQPTLLSDEGVKDDSERQTSNYSDAELKECYNCKKAIGALEDAHIFKGKVVCTPCYTKLKEFVLKKEGS